MATILEGMTRAAGGRVPSRGIFLVLGPVLIVFLVSAAAALFGVIPHGIDLLGFCAVVLYAGIVVFCSKVARLYRGRLALSLAWTYAFVLGCELLLLIPSFNNHGVDILLAPNMGFVWLSSFWFQIMALQVILAAMKSFRQPKTAIFLYVLASLILLALRIGFPALRHLADKPWWPFYLGANIAALGAAALILGRKLARRLGSSKPDLFTVYMAAAAAFLLVSLAAGGAFFALVSEAAMLASWFARLLSAYFAYEAVVVYAFLVPREADLKELELRDAELRAARGHAELLAADLERRLAEREVLLAEVHHRVKNNLQILSSLVQLEACKRPEPEVVEAFKSFDRKLRSIAGVHDLLYKSADLAQVRLAEYLENVVRFFETGAFRRVSFESDEGSGSLRASLERAIPLGLAVNELITNSIKHAGLGPSELEIRVGFEAKEGSTLIEVGDNGQGFPPGMEPEGLLITNALVTQTGGRLSLSNRPGALARIEIPA